MSYSSLPFRHSTSSTLPLDSANTLVGSNTSNQRMKMSRILKSQNMSDSPYPTRIDLYNLGNMLGKGAFGSVYSATCIVHGLSRQVAVKKVDKDLIFAADMDQRVADEVQIHSTLDHPSILPLYQYFEDDRHVYMIMELCERGELFRFIQKRQKPLSEPEARTVLTQVVTGLQYLHARGIIHRDLKLSNLLLTKDLDVRIGDFGLAVQINDHTGEQQTMCGTPNYISPEIVMRLPYGLASDLWSLGCLIATCLTGKPPFESKQVKNTLERVSKAEYEIPSNVSPEAQDLITSLLQKDPRRRPQLATILEHVFFKLPRCGLSQTVEMGLPPLPYQNTLSTARLNPIKQQTKHGIIEITQDGRVILQTSGKEMIISPDGIQVTVSNSYSQNLYSVHRLPESDSRHYRYAKRFVDLVKSKTVKLVYQTQNSTSRLMENGDFETVFTDGTRISWQGTIVQISMQGRIQHCTPQTIPSSPLLDEAQMLRQNCMELQSTGELDNAPSYPIVVSSNNQPRPVSRASVGSLHPSNLSTYSRLTEQTRSPTEMREKSINWLQQAKFIPNVGWMVTNSDWSLMLFQDGCLFKLDAIRQMISVREKGGLLQHYRISRDLPISVRQRLRDFVAISKLY